MKPDFSKYNGNKNVNGVVILLLIILTAYSLIKSYGLIKGNPGQMIDSNMNGIVKEYINVQNNAKEVAGISETNFFDYNNIYPEDIYAMGDKNYFVLYHNNGKTLNEKQLADIVTYYREQTGAFNVYLLDLGKYGDLGMRVKLEFITTDSTGLKFTTNFWEDAGDIVELPYKE